MTEEQKKNFQFLKEGLTRDLLMLLVQQRGMDPINAMNALFDSTTYSKLSDPATLLYIQSANYVYSYLEDELKYGRFMA